MFGGEYIYYQLFPKRRRIKKDQREFDFCFIANHLTRSKNFWRWGDRRLKYQLLITGDLPDLKKERRRRRIDFWKEKKDKRGFDFYFIANFLHYFKNFWRWGDWQLKYWSLIIGDDLKKERRRIDFWKEKKRSTWIWLLFLLLFT